MTTTDKQREMARRELARRELARRELVPFAWYTFRGYQPAAVHYLLASYLEQVERFVATGGEEGIDRLMVFMPPRHGKSELVSVRFPAWFLGRNSDKRVILSSCTASLAEGFSRQVRDIVKAPSYQRLWDIQVSQESRAASAWDLSEKRGGVVAAGVGGSIIGRGAHLSIIDDPFKDRKEAESKATRDAIDDWYRSTLYTRLEDGAAVVLMHQRWHSDDEAGKLIKRMVEETGADQWVILCLPAIAEPWAGGVDPEKARNAAKDGWWMAPDALGREPGDPLWPEKYGLDVLESIKINIGVYEWSALYQQRPRKLEGALIKAHEIPVMDRVPEGLRLARYWDLAVSGKESADYICGAKIGRASDGRLYILDIARFPGPWADARPRMVATMLRDGAAVDQGIEISGQQGGYCQELQRDEKLQGIPIKGVDPSKVGNKEVRANVWASRIEDGLVAMVRAPWNDQFVSEALAFPRGGHDDQVDAVSGAVQMLPGVVSFSDVPQAPDTPSQWDLFGEAHGGMGASFAELLRDGRRVNA